MNIKEVYEKYQHLDTLLSDGQWCGNGIRDQILYDLWQAVKNDELVKQLQTWAELKEELRKLVIII